MREQAPALVVSTPSFPPTRFAPELEVTLNVPKWKVIAALNLALGALLWLGYLTDYSWVGTLPDILFLLLVGVVASVSLDELGETASASAEKVVRWARLPSRIGVGVAVLSVILMLIPPFTLGFIFMMTEMGKDVLIQRAVSPNGLRVAEVYFTPVGAYGAGNGHISIRLKPRWFPLVEREVFYLNASYADEDTSNYVHWVDDRTLYVSEVQEEIHPGIVKVQLAPILAFPLNLLRCYWPWRGASLAHRAIPATGYQPMAR